MNKFQLEECLQKQKKWYIHHPEALKKLVSEADYDFEDPLQNSETLEYYTVDEFSDKERDILYEAYCDIYVENLKNKKLTSNNFTVIDNYFAVIYQDTIDVFPKEKLNDYLLKKGCLVCDLETAKDYKKFHKVYSVSNEKWVRDYFGLV